ncbi:MAG TPA: tetratricopeptide repeat protein [archaeon]|nr:tetratricopeptide repeat protein [archaeon]
MKLSHIITASFLAVSGACGVINAAEITDLQVFSENDYARVAFRLDGTVNPQLETNIQEQLVFIRFDQTKVGALDRQSFIYDDNPHIESVTLLPMGQGATVARIKARHPFKIRTFDIQNPRRFILEISENSFPGKQPGSLITTDSYYQHGLSQMQKGIYNAALISFRNAIRAGNQVADSYYQAGLIRCRLGQYDNALVNFSRAGQSTKYGPAVSLYLSWLHYRNGNLQAMKENWERFLGQMPDEAERTRLAASHPDIDYRVLEAAVTGKDRNPVASGELSAPAQELEPQQSVSQDSAALYFQKGMELKAEGHLLEAVEYLKKTLAVDKNHSQACFELGVIYKSLGQSELSTSYFEKSLGENHELKAPVEITEEKLPDRENDELKLASRIQAEDPGTRDSQQAGSVREELNSEKSPGRDPGIKQAAIETTGKTSPAPVEQPFLKTLRAGAARIVSLPDVRLLRQQVKLLTLLLGILFVLILIGGRLVLRKSNPGRKALPVKTDSVSGSGNKIERLDRSVKAGQSMAERKRQVERVLAAELVAKQRGRTTGEGRNETQGKEKAGNSGMLELRFQPVGQRVVYGADIAHRIKEELLKEEKSEAVGSSGSLFGRRRDDIQTRLIRQLRSKNWTISDIAQEMDLSREEIKWALAGISSVGESMEDDKIDRFDGRQYGQARGLLNVKPDELSKMKPDEIDREVDFELQINV